MLFDQPNSPILLGADFGFVFQSPPELTFGIALLAAFLAWYLYFREVRGEFRPLPAAIIPLIRTLAVFMIAVTLLEPSWQSEQRVGDPPQLQIIVDNSASMGLPQRVGSDPESSLDATSRLGRLKEILYEGESNIIGRLGEKFDIVITQVDAPNEVYWTRKAASEPVSPPLSIDADDATSSSLSLAVLSRCDDLISAQQGGMILLLSDGCNTEGVGLVEAAKECNEAGTPLHALGFGPSSQFNDLAVLSADAPVSVGLQDVLRGKARISESVPEGTKLEVQVRSGEQILWRQEYFSRGQSEREVEFSIPAKEILVSQIHENSAQHNSVAVRLDVIVVTENPEALDPVWQNNSRSFSTQVTIQKRKLLLVDGRPRWETRYLNNLLNRDKSWEVTKVVASPLDRELTGLPSDKAELAQYNCIILGEVRAKLLPIEFRSLVERYVADGVGGIGFIDGARGYWHKESVEELQSLFPVTWDPLLETTATEPFRVELDETFAGPETQGSTLESLPKLLPALGFVAQCQPLLGSETLAVAKSDIESRPLLITRQFGAGMVFYMATDETWKWRYQKADKLHGQFWGQLINKISSVPFSKQGEFVDLDTGKASYQLGEEILIRSRLRDASGEPASGQRVFARISDASGETIDVALEEDPSMPGAYSIRLDDLETGNYSVELRSTATPSSALAVASTFAVVAKENREFERLTQADDVLKAAAERSGGSYFPQSKWSELVELLRSQSGFSVVKTISPLWDTTYWFCISIGLFIADWLLRKRLGLV